MTSLGACTNPDPTCIGEDGVISLEPLTETDNPLRVDTQCYSTENLQTALRVNRKIPHNRREVRLNSNGLPVDCGGEEATYSDIDPMNIVSVAQLEQYLREGRSLNLIRRDPELWADTPFMSACERGRKNVALRMIEYAREEPTLIIAGRPSRDGNYTALTLCIEQANTNSLDVALRILDVFGHAPVIPERPNGMTFANIQQRTTSEANTPNVTALEMAQQLVQNYDPPEDSFRGRRTHGRAYDKLLEIISQIREIKRRQQEGGKRKKRRRPRKYHKKSRRGKKRTQHKRKKTNKKSRRKRRKQHK